MKIAVLVKQVPGADSPLPIQSNQNWVDEGAAAFIMNESDNYALEEALQIRESMGEGEVVAVSLGPDRIQKVIREALAKGADRAIHIQMDTEGVIDPLVTASHFAHALKEENFDDIEKEKFVINSSKGWLGITDKYWLTAIVPEKNSEFKAEFAAKNEKKAKIKRCFYFRKFDDFKKT